MKRLRNSSGIPDETVRQIVNWIAGRLGISQFDVECRSSQSTLVGRAYTTGTKLYHGNRRPFVVLRIGTETIDRSTSDGGKRISLRRSWLGTAHRVRQAPHEINILLRHLLDVFPAGANF